MEAVKDIPAVANRAYVFPGQGSQRVGMGWELYTTSRAAKDVFQEADESLGFPLSRIIFEGPGNQLQDTINSQPGIMTVSMACWKALEESLGAPPPQPTSVAGHSLGEYTALVVAGVLGFGDSVRLARERGRLMRQAAAARPGGMAAIIGLDDLALEHICAETGVEVANINSDDQVVISGNKLALAHAMDLAHLRGARKTIPLPVSGAFHSSFMGQARQGLAEAIAKLDFRDPKVPIIANSTGAPLTTSAQVKEELEQGLCQCVQWKNSVQYMVRSGVSQFVEFGPTRILTTLIKQINRDAQAVTLCDPDSIRKMVERAV